jgi:hypothetical protein
MRVSKQNTLSCDLIKIRRPDNIVDATMPVHIGVDPGVSTPVISEQEQNIRASGLCRLLSHGRTKSDYGDQNAQHELHHQLL